MKRREIAVIICAVILLLLLIALFFFPELRYFNSIHDPHHFSDGRFLEMMREKIDLSDEQYVSISAVFAKDEKLRMANRAKIAQKISILDSLLIKDQFDEPAVRKILEEIDNLKREDRILIMKKRYEIDKYLSPEQRNILHEHMKKKMQRFRERFEPEGNRLPEDD